MHSSHSAARRAKWATPEKGSPFLVFSHSFIGLNPFSPEKAHARPAPRSSGPVPFHGAAKPSLIRQISADAPNTRLTCEQRVCCYGGQAGILPTQPASGGQAARLNFGVCDRIFRADLDEPTRHGSPPEIQHIRQGGMGMGQRAQVAGQDASLRENAACTPTAHCARITDAGTGSFRPCGAALERADHSAKKKERAQGPLFPQIVSDQIRTTS